MDSKYVVVQDKDFGFFRVDPLPTQQEVEKFYLDEFYSVKYKSFNDSSLAAQKESEEFYVANWKNALMECQRHFGMLKGKSVFDIGCGFSQALLYFREQGLSVSGLEPSPEGVAYARSQGLDVHLTGIEDFSCVGSQRFDIVTLFNVLEHLRSPVETLCRIGKELLKPGGILIVDVPNEFNDFQLVGNQEFGLKEWWVCPPNHINYFSASSLKKTMEKCGYQVLRMESSFPLEMFLLMGDVYVGDGVKGKECHHKRVDFERLMRKHGKGQKLKDLYRSLADLDLGRQVVAWGVNKG